MKKTNNLFILIFFALFMVGCSSVNNKKEEYYLLKGMNYARDGKYTKAIKEYEKTLDNNSKNLYALKEQAKAYTALKEYKKSISNYKKVLKIEKNNPESLKGISYSYYLNKDYSNALKYLKKVPEDELDIDSKMLKALVLSKNKYTEKAIFEFEEAFSKIDTFNKEYSEIYLSLLNKEKKREKMRIFLEEEREKYFDVENFVIFYVESIKIYFEEFDLAEEILKRYISNYGGSDNLYVTLAKTIYDGQKIKNLKI